MSSATPNSNNEALELDNEKHAVRIDERDEALKGYDVNADHYDSNVELKKTPDGRIALIPQPSDSPDDPLNWSPRKKAITLAIVGYIAFLADYTAGTGIVTLIPQAM